MSLTDTFEYFAGIDNGKVTWVSDRNDRQPIRTDTDSIHWGPTIAFNPVLKRYLLCYFSDTSANLRCFDGPEPWGPWTLVHASAKGNPSPPLTSGKSAWDSLNVLRAVLITDGSLPKAPYNVSVE